MSTRTGRVHEHGAGDPWIMLHGFTQTGACFDELCDHMGVRGIAPDLPGHGPEPMIGDSLIDTAEGVADVLRSAPRPLPLLGYSQGGRVALHVALEHPELISVLVVISASPGISDGASRSERARRDEARAQEILDGGLEAFLTSWSALPMFEGLRERDQRWRDQDRARRLVHTPEGLAGALRTLGLGQQEDLLPRFKELQMPCLFVAGADDPTYVEHAFSMASAAPRGAAVFLPGVGHAAVGQAPREVARLLRMSL
ncbi:MAG: 2-succinyl-6-hydroxy-2,4-cyclohexadiene-1-carboxylate synthase [Deltaproteobacteria bacterium]|nr:2-succinyl-6-hydroxy-2,4-cyclohexadiene-1-carboxylate synthase [Deltaproteobacteria bacterium]